MDDNKAIEAMKVIKLYCGSRKNCYDCIFDSFTECHINYEFMAPMDWEFEENDGDK